MIKRVAEGVVRLEWLVLAMLAPLLIFPNAGRSLALLGIPLIWVARKIARGRFICRTPLDWAITLLMFMVLVSLYATFDIAVSLPRIALVLLGIAIYYATVEVAQSDAGLRWVCAGCLLSGVGIAALAAVGMQKVQKLPILGQVMSRLPMLVRGISQNPEGLHPNIVAGALLWFIPLSLTVTAWLWRKHNKSKYQMGLSFLMPVGIAGVLGIMIVTQSRGGIAGLGIGLLILLICTGRWGRWLAGVTAVVAIVALLGLGPAWLGEVFVGANTPIVQGAEIETLNGRLELWSRTFYAIQDFPFTGMGMGTFGDVIPVLYPLFLISPDSKVYHAHDEFLQVAVDLGLPGLVAFISIYVMVVGSLTHMLMQDRDAFRQAVALGVQVGLISHAVYGLTDAVLLGAKPGLVWWALLGLASSAFGLYAQSQSKGAVTRTGTA